MRYGISWALLLVFLVSSDVANAAGKLGVTDAWVRAAPPGAQMQAGYATLSNNGDAPLTVLTVQSDKFRMTSLHETVIDSNGVSKMRELHRVVIEPGAKVSLTPGGKHLMLMHPRTGIAVGDKVEVVFLLADGDRVVTNFDVVSADAAPGGH